jgi:hypothetical protein
MTKKPRIHQEWDDTADKELKVITVDGVQKLIYPDGTEEILDKDHPRYNHWAGK